MSTARRTYYVRGVVHVAIAGAETALCGVPLVGKVPTEHPVTCEACHRHPLEQHPTRWVEIVVADQDGEPR